MELKDNFTNRYFKPDLVKTQMDLVNQPTAADAVGEGYQKLGSQPANGASQRMSNAVLTGLGSGIKAAANSERQEKLDPILEMTGQINAQNAYLEAQNQDHIKQKNVMIDFIRNNAGSIQDLGNSSMQDNPNAQKIAKHLSDELQRATGVNFGEFDYYDAASRKNFYRQPNGSTVGYSVLDVMRPFAKEALGEQAQFIMRGLDPYHEEQYKNSEEVRQLSINKGEADINNTNAQANHHNAQTGEIENKIANPQLSPAQTKTKELNQVKFEELHEKAEEKRILSMAYDMYIDNIEDAKKKDLTGKSKGAEWRRFWAGVTGQSENMDIEDMLRITHANRVKELGGSNANIKQFEVAMESAPSIKKDPDATITFLNNIIDENNTFEKEVNHLGQIWNSNDYQGQRRAILNDYRRLNKTDKPKANQENPKNNQNDGIVVMTNQETGEEWDVPEEQVDLFSKNGYK